MALSDYLNQVGKTLTGGSPKDSWVNVGRQTLGMPPRKRKSFDQYPSVAAPAPSAKMPPDDDDEDRWG